MDAMTYLIHEGDSLEVRLEKTREFHKLTTKQRMEWLIEVTNRLLEANPDLANQPKEWLHTTSVQVLEMPKSSRSTFP